MAGYKPLYIKKYETGLVQSRVDSIIPEDAFPVLENAYIFRERIKRKLGFELLGRLRRVLEDQDLGLTAAAQLTYTFVDVFASFTPAIGVNEPNKEIQPGSLVITIGAPDSATFTDQGNGTFIVTGAGVAVGSSVNYATGEVVLVLSASTGGAAITADISYFPTLPVMGLRSRELNNINNEETIAFDTIYAYEYSGGWEEFIPGTTWTGNDSDFFWSTNWWVNSSNQKLFWVTNFSTNDPIRYTDGTTWTDFGPTINSSADILAKCLCILPFRSRLLTFNIFEGQDIATSVQFRQRVRWSAIGNPLIADAWRDDIRGKGGYLDIPTAEDIVSVGYVRDNLVIYCERSTWQLRYTGRSISPFQIEKVNTELGAESTFSTVQFDTSLVGIGDKGIVECDSFKSNRIDIKITDLVFQFSNQNNGPKRVHGIRDFFNRLAYWTYPYNATSATFPDRRLVYNYENDSWAIFTDSFTCFGNYQPQETRIWEEQEQSWEESTFQWIDSPALFPDIVAGNQQGYVLIINKQANNEESLTIRAITGRTPFPTRIESVNHNMQDGQVIKIVDIPALTPFANLNDQIFSIIRFSDDEFDLYLYNPLDEQFTIPQQDPVGDYVGGGQIQLRDNFSIKSKKFNYLDQGQNIQFGFADINFNTTSEGEVSLNVYVNYSDETPVNNDPQNVDDDLFFNTVIPTTLGNGLYSSKTFQRVYAQARGAFITLEYNLSNLQMTTNAQASEVEMDTQILWFRPAGTQLQQNF